MTSHVQRNKCCPSAQHCVQLLYASHTCHDERYADACLYYLSRLLPEFWHHAAVVLCQMALHCNAGWLKFDCCSIGVMA